MLQHIYTSRCQLAKQNRIYYVSNCLISDVSWLLHMNAISPHSAGRWAFAWVKVGVLLITTVQLLGSIRSGLTLTFSLLAYTGQAIWDWRCSSVANVQLVYKRPYLEEFNTHFSKIYVFETSSFNFNIWIKQDFVPTILCRAHLKLHQPNWIYFKRANLMSIYKRIYFKSPNNEYPLYNRIASGGSISRIWILVPSRPDPVVFTNRTSSAGGWSRGYYLSPGVPNQPKQLHPNPVSRGGGEVGEMTQTLKTRFPSLKKKLNKSLPLHDWHSQTICRMIYCSASVFHCRSTLDVLNSWADKRREAVGILRTRNWRVQVYQILPNTAKICRFSKLFKHFLNIQQTRIKN